MPELWDLETWKKRSSGGLLARRNHPVILNLDELVALFHQEAGSRTPEANLRQTAILFAIWSRSGYYLFSHDQSKCARWNAVEMLQKQAEDLLKSLRTRPLPTRGLRPGEKFRAAAGLMAGRAVTGFQPTRPMHKAGYFLEAWGDDHVGASGAENAFRAWLHLYEDPDAGAEGEIRLKENAPSFWDWWTSQKLYNPSGVVYLSAEEREAYRVEVSGGILSWACGAGRLHSMGLKWIGEDDDVFIFVISPDRVLHANQGIANKFHHSSFLGGRPVLGAGQLIVNNGRLTMVSNSSGHYRPDPARHFNTLLFFRRSGIDLSTVRSVLYGEDGHREATARDHYAELAPVYGVRSRLSAAQKLELFSAMEPQARRKFLAGRGETEEQYVRPLQEAITREASDAAGRLFGSAGSTGAPKAKEGGDPEEAAGRLFGREAGSTDPLRAGISETEAEAREKAMRLFDRPAGSSDDLDLDFAER